MVCVCFCYGYCFHLHSLELKDFSEYAQLLSCVVTSYTTCCGSLFRETSPQEKNPGQDTYPGFMALGGHGSRLYDEILPPYGTGTGIFFCFPFGCAWVVKTCLAVFCGFQAATHLSASQLLRPCFESFYCRGWLWPTALATDVSFVGPKEGSTARTVCSGYY